MMSISDDDASSCACTVFGAYYFKKMTLNTEVLYEEWQPNCIVAETLLVPGVLLVVLMSLVFRMGSRKLNSSRHIYNCFTLIMVFQWVGNIGTCSPSSRIAMFGGLGQVVCLAFGVPFVIMRLDKDVGSTCQRAYRGVLALLSSAITFVFLTLGTDAALSPIMRTVAVNACGAMCMTALHRCCKYAFGDDDDQTAIVYPSIFLSIELANAVIFLGTSLSDPSFYVIMILQETWSLFRNCGLSSMVLNKMKEVFCGSEITKERIAMQRRNLKLMAPSDNFAEIMSVAFILIVFLMEQLYMAVVPRDVAPDTYPAVLRLWYKDVGGLATGQMLAVLLVFRCCFLKFE